MLLRKKIGGSRGPQIKSGLLKDFSIIEDVKEELESTEDKNLKLRYLFLFCLTNKFETTPIMNHNALYQKYSEIEEVKQRNIF